MRYLGNNNISLWFFVFWCWTFVTRFYVHKFYWTGFHFLFLNYEYLIISGVKIKKLWFFISTLISLLVFLKTVRLNIIMVMCLSNIFCAIVPYCKIKSDILFPPLNINKSLEQRRGYNKFLLWKVPGLSGRCTFAFANGLAFWFFSKR